MISYKLLAKFEFLDLISTMKIKFAKLSKDPCVSIFINERIDTLFITFVPKAQYIPVTRDRDRADGISWINIGP